MLGMFAYSPSFNQDISSFATSNVLDMGFMFFLAEEFNQNIGGWDTSSVTGMTAMFAETSAFFQDLSGWAVEDGTECLDFAEGANPSWTSNFWPSFSCPTSV